MQREDVGQNIGSDSDRRHNGGRVLYLVSMKTPINHRGRTRGLRLIRFDDQKLAHRPEVGGFDQNGAQESSSTSRAPFHCSSPDVNSGARLAVVAVSVSVFRGQP